MLLSPARSRKAARKPPLRHRFVPRVEQLEERDMLAVVIAPGPDVNISRLHDNQAEATITVNPMDPQKLFAASMTFHGYFEGTFNPTINLPYPNWKHTPGILGAYSTDSGATWTRQVMLTGGPNEPGAADVARANRSLPAAAADPQATFDSFGNLFLTYLSAPLVQIGTATAGGVNTLTDTSRQWATDIWNTFKVTINPGVLGDPTLPGKQDTREIRNNDGTQLTLNADWYGTNQPGPNTPYIITVNGVDEAGSPLAGNAAWLLKSTNGGASFTLVKWLGVNADYPTVAIGPGLQNDKSVWVAWKSNINGNIVATGAPVTAQGMIGNFIPLQVVNGSADMVHPRAQVGPNGQVMVSFHTFDTGIIPTSIYVNVDDDGLAANGFRANAVPVATSTVVMNPTPLPPYKFYEIPSQPNRGITPQVNLAWDRSGAFVAAPNGRVYLIYTTAFPWIGSPDTDIWVTWSDDSGANWAPPKRVHDANTKSQFLPAVAVDQQTGHVAVVWLDARDDPNNTKTMLYGTVSVDGGATFEIQRFISGAQSNASESNRLQRGATTGNNTEFTLNDTNQNWAPPGTPNNYWTTDYRVLITGTGGAAGEIGYLSSNTATQLTIDPGWTEGKIPALGETYEIQIRIGYDDQMPPQPIYSIYKFDFGEYIGLAFHDGVFYPIWADNSGNGGLNPNYHGEFSALDVYTARVQVLMVEEDQSLGASASGTRTIALGTRRFTGFPEARLLEAALLLGARRTFPSRAPSGATYDQFIRDTRAMIQKLSAQVSASPSSPARLLLGGSTPRPTPTIEAIDRFFSAAWADGVLSEADLSLRLL